MTTILIWLSALSFLFYGISYFTSQKLKDEFKRYGLAKFGPLTAVLEILGGLGLLVGLQVPLILSVASGGLAVLMLLGFGVRMKIKDGFWLSLPSFLFMLLNAYIFYVSLQAY
ncbi:DoxX family protein [Hymenobacter canadensis]|uniref:DoxX family protein n=1 Tax=Hymenobacter canadensis TaxID=2999067 RepID=A0ABY7LMT0_9BACT|nr:DoxX family protein [Hymenobacter canadensis]WBA41751.1 DoxX family protein [Hymenobacter canadensis]